MRRGHRAGSTTVWVPKRVKDRSCSGSKVGPLLDRRQSSCELARCCDLQDPYHLGVSITRAEACLGLCIVSPASPQFRLRYGPMLYTEDSNALQQAISRRFTYGPQWLAAINGHPAWPGLTQRFGKGMVVAALLVGTAVGGYARDFVPRDFDPSDFDPRALPQIPALAMIQTMPPAPLAVAAQPSTADPAGAQSALVAVADQVGPGRSSASASARPRLQRASSTIRPDWCSPTPTSSRGAPSPSAWKMDDGYPPRSSAPIGPRSRRAQA